MKYIDIVMARGPGPDSDFIEVENPKGASIHLGTWLKDEKENCWILRVTEEDFIREMSKQ